MSFFHFIALKAYFCKQEGNIFLSVGENFVLIRYPLINQNLNIIASILHEVFPNFRVGECLNSDVPVENYDNIGQGSASVPNRQQVNTPTNN